MESGSADAAGQISHQCTELNKVLLESTVSLSLMSLVKRYKVLSLACAVPQLILLVEVVLNVNIALHGDIQPHNALT